ncbi:hypothetical protein [Streptomyces sp. 3211]|uniref:hypothetical protein n=1 Tax=Streptomyces sp. 3211 TaxID=1964449 RepID=UPI0013314455|nr:hypothetical protein [Streptomyces sp. 3211]
MTSETADTPNPRANAMLVETLAGALRSTESGLTAVPDLLARVLTEGSWRSFITPRGEHVKHDGFEDFVTTPPTHGIGSSLGLIRRVVGDRVDVLDLLDQALQRNSAQGRCTDIVDDLDEVGGIEPRAPGSSAARGMRWLRDNRPDLLERVTAGELSTNAAMIEAKQRDKMVSVPVHKPDRVARALLKQMTPDERRQLVDLLSAELDT